MVVLAPGGSVVKYLPENAGDARDAGSIAELGRSPGVGNGNPLQYSWLENPMDRGVWWATVHEAAELGATKQASIHSAKNHFIIVLILFQALS